MPLHALCIQYDTLLNASQCQSLIHCLGEHWCRANDGVILVFMSDVTQILSQVEQGDPSAGIGEWGHHAWRTTTEPDSWPFPGLRYRHPDLGDQIRRLGLPRVGEVLLKRRRVAEIPHAAVDLPAGHARDEA